MEDHRVKTENINDFREWFYKQGLILAPEFQRRKVWLPKAKSFLIDTIIRKFPIPAICLRQKIDLKTGKTIREVVDGQQRIGTILEYLNDEFAILKVHNKDYGSFKFSDLPEDIKRKFLEYELPVVYLYGANNQDVLEVFSRINSYTVTLNKQEKLNADFLGSFKQLVFKLGRDHLNFWKKYNILSDYNIMRMKEAELCSELVIAMIDGIQDKKKIEDYYKKYEDDFPSENEIERNFKQCIDKIAEIYGDDPKQSPFKKSTLLYSLFCAIYDITHGLPRSKNKTHIQIKPDQYNGVRNALSNLGKELTSAEPSLKYSKFKEASTRHTTDIKNRLIRHRFIVKEILEKILR